MITLCPENRIDEISWVSGFYQYYNMIVKWAVCDLQKANIKMLKRFIFFNRFRNYSISVRYMVKHVLLQVWFLLTVQTRTFRESRNQKKWQGCFTFEVMTYSRNTCNALPNMYGLIDQWHRCKWISSVILTDTFCMALIWHAF